MSAARPSRLMYPFTPSLYCLGLPVGRAIVALTQRVRARAQASGVTRPVS